MCILADEEAVYLMDHPDSDEEIPTLAVAPYLNGEPRRRATVAAQLGEISRTAGFFYLKGHGIPPDLIDHVFEESRRFHTLPDETKKKIPSFETGSFRSGYQPCFKDKHQRTNINRYSIPVFFGPSGDAMIEVLPTCQGPGRPTLRADHLFAAARMVLRAEDLIRQSKQGQ